MPMSGVKATFYNAETTYGTPILTSPWSWFGYVQNLSPVPKKDKKRIPYLGDATSGISKVMYIDAGGSINAKLTYVAQDYDFFDAFAHGSLSYFSLAQLIEDEANSKTYYIIYPGCTVDTATLAYNEFGEVSADYDITIGNVEDPVIVDPLGVGGSWEAEPADDALMWEDVSDLKWNTAPFTDITGGFKFTVKSELKYPKDKNSTLTWTKIAGPILNLREYEFSVDVTYKTMDFFGAVKNSTAGDIEWTSNVKIFKATSMVFDTFDITQDPENYLGSTMVAKSDGTVFTLV